MPKNEAIKKVLVVGSGPIIIGQAAEFDYAGTQACRTLKQEGLEVVLVNSNPATIMTDKGVADKTYIEPINIETIEKIIKVEKPDSILPALGGQTGLNMAMELYEKGILQENGVKMLGTSPISIKKAEDRQAFKDTMEEIGEPCVPSDIAINYEHALEIAKKIGFPVIIRPAYTLGGTGGGIAYNEKEFHEIANAGLEASRVHQILVEKCISGWKEIEFEVMRDAKGNCITICSMENVDPVGIHTGDSIVVAPAQTLSDKEYQMLRTSALKIIDALEVEGGCNVQFALEPNSFEYSVIEVNPRVSRSSALASKATGYPIAKVSTKIAIGYTLDEIINQITKETYACFEPAIDYIVVKFPKFPFNKFITAPKTLGTQMKATGEVMAIDTTFEAALLKAVRSLEENTENLSLPTLPDYSKDELYKKLKDVDSQRLFVIASAIRKGITIKEIAEITKIDYWFLERIEAIIQMENTLKNMKIEDAQTLAMAKQMGYTDKLISKFSGIDEKLIKAKREENGIVAVFKMVDTCAGEFEAATPYYYSTYGTENEVNTKTDKKKVIVLGSGPIRIGQGIEFDYCSVHAVWGLKESGYETIIINNNPETVSTDFDIADKLYFEPLTKEDVRNIVELEKPYGAVVQFGGQTAIKLTKDLMEMGVKILGTDAKDVDRAEDRKLFEEALNKCNIKRPVARTVFTVEEAITAAHEIGYPVLVRPSYVLGGQGMAIAFNDDEMHKFIDIINQIAQENPILIDKYVMGKEVEVDAICDGEDVLIPGIMEHIERAGVHSGDSICVYPAQTVSKHCQEVMLKYTRDIARQLNVMGMINIQFIVQNEEVYIIEVNPRSSRTVPYISKITGLPIIKIATRVILGEKLKNLGYGTGVYKKSEYIAVKMPVFSFEKIVGAEVSLGPEMKSTGEVLGISKDYDKALYKAFLGSNMKVPKEGLVVITVNNKDKKEIVDIAKEFRRLGFSIVSTYGTMNFLRENGVAASFVPRIDEDPKNNIVELIRKGQIALVVNTPTRGNQEEADGFKIRRAATECRVTCLTALDTVKAILKCIGEDKTVEDLDVVDVNKI